MTVRTNIRGRAIEGRTKSAVYYLYRHFYKPCLPKKDDLRKSIHLGQYVENLGVHQSSPVSVLGYTKNLSTDLNEKMQIYTQLWRAIEFEFKKKVSWTHT